MGFLAQNLSSITSRANSTTNGLGRPRLSSSQQSRSPTPLEASSGARLQREANGRLGATVGSAPNVARDYFPLGNNTQAPTNYPEGYVNSRGREGAAVVGVVPLGFRMLAGVNRGPPGAIVGALREVTAENGPCVASPLFRCSRSFEDRLTWKHGRLLGCRHLLALARQCIMKWARGFGAQQGFRVRYVTTTGMDRICATVVDGGGWAFGARLRSRGRQHA